MKVDYLVILSPAELVASLSTELCLVSRQQGTLHNQEREEEEEKDMESDEVVGGHVRTKDSKSLNYLRAAI